MSAARPSRCAATLGNAPASPFTNASADVADGRAGAGETGTIASVARPVAIQARRIARSDRPAQKRGEIARAALDIAQVYKRLPWSRVFDDSG